jgi:hypothetical protein
MRPHFENRITGLFGVEVPIANSPMGPVGAPRPARSPGGHDRAVLEGQRDVDDAVGDGLGPRPVAVLDRGPEPVLAQELVTRPGLGHPVGAEDEQVARRQHLDRVDAFGEVDHAPREDRAGRGAPTGPMRELAIGTSTPNSSVMRFSKCGRVVTPGA